MPSASETPVAATQAVVIGLELPGFAKLPVAAQCRQQEQLQRRLSAALQTLPQKDRIVLDTPTGAAVVLFATPAAALNIACALCGTRSAENGSIAVRAGIDLGPIKAVPAHNGQLQIAGDALEVAEHIATLVPGERVVTTRTYAEALRKELPTCAPALRALPKGAEPEALPCELVAVQITHPSVLAFRRKRSGQSRSLLGWFTLPRAALASLALMLTAFTWTTVGNSARSAKATDAPVAAVSPAAAEAVQVASIESAAEPEGDANAEADEISVAPDTHSAQATDTLASEDLPRHATSVKIKRSLKVASATTHKAAGGTPVAEASIETPQVLANPGERGKVLLAIAPWGEVLVDGRPVGVSPPLTELELDTGSHYLEVRNGASAPLLRRIDVQGNETLKIRHRFADSQ